MLCCASESDGSDGAVAIINSPFITSLNLKAIDLLTSYIRFVCVEYIMLRCSLVYSSRLAAANMQCKTFNVKGSTPVQFANYIYTILFS